MSYHAHFIEKAKKPRAKWKATRTYHRLDALQRRMGAAIGADLVTGVQRFKKRIAPEKVYDAWLNKDWHGLMTSMDWEKLTDDLTPAMERNGDTVREAWKTAIPSLPAPARNSLRIDTHNPRIRQFIASRTAKNFVNLTQDSADNIQKWVTRSLDRALSPRQVANGIKDQIGLLPAHAEAVRKYAEGLTAAGQPIERVNKLASAYADRLLDYRAMMIGRTETRLATNRGQIDVWRAAADEGLINRESTGKMWVVDGEPCEDCAPMDGVTVPLDGFWTMDDGSTIDYPPEDVHPNCYCGMDIVYDWTPEE